MKKGTPLYGQPEWWGEEESDLNLGNECVKRMSIISLSNFVPKTSKVIWLGKATITDQAMAPQGRNTQHRHPHNSKNTKFSLSQQDDCKTREEMQTMNQQQ